MKGPERTLDVLVPRSGTPAERAIDAGSAIVARQGSEDRVLVCFEGNGSGADDIVSFDDKVMQAAGLLVQRRWAIARGTFVRNDFQLVGTYTFSNDWLTRKLEITNRESLEKWTGRSFGQ